MSACKSCGASVVWAVTEAGKRIPLDADATGAPLWVTDGSMVTAGFNESGMLRVVVEAGGPYRTHFQSCPQADSHRKPRR